MTDITTQAEEQAATQLGDELSLLKQRAQIMGIPFSNNIGIETLRERIHQKMDADEKVSEKVEAPVVSNPLIGDAPPAKRAMTWEESTRKQLQEDELKLIRLRITNLDPKKKDLPGEIFTVANEYLGTVRKYVPFGEVTDDGYHVPYIIYRQLEARKFLNIRTVKNRTNGELSTSHSWAKEFALEVLPPLTDEERASLAAAQSAAGLFGTE